MKDLYNNSNEQLELRALQEGLKEKCPITYKNKLYFCGKCRKCGKELKERKENK